MPAEELEVDIAQTHAAAHFRTVRGKDEVAPEPGSAASAAGPTPRPLSLETAFGQKLRKHHKKKPRKPLQVSGPRFSQVLEGLLHSPSGPATLTGKKAEPEVPIAEPIHDRIMPHPHHCRKSRWKNPRIARLSRHVGRSIKSRGVDERPTWSAVVAEHSHPHAHCDDTRVRSRTTPHSVLDRCNFHCGGPPNGPIRGSRCC